MISFLIVDYNELILNKMEKLKGLLTVDQKTSNRENLNIKYSRK